MALSLCLTGVRGWDLKVDYEHLSFQAYSELWSLITAIFLLATLACRVALDEGGLVVEATYRTETDKSTEESLKRIRKALIAPLLALLMPVIAGFTIWCFRRETLRTLFGFNVATAVTCGLLLPLGVLLQMAYRYKVVLRDSSDISASPIHSTSNLRRFAPIGVVTYICGFGAEAIGHKGYTMWTVCFVVLGLVIVSFSKFAQTAAELSSYGARRELSDLFLDKKRSLFFILSWMAFAYIYILLLSFVL